MSKRNLKHTALILFLIALLNACWFGFYSVSDWSKAPSGGEPGWNIVLFLSFGCIFFIPVAAIIATVIYYGLSKLLGFKPLRAVRLASNSILVAAAIGFCPVILFFLLSSVNNLQRGNFKQSIFYQTQQTFKLNSEAVITDIVVEPRRFTSGKSYEITFQFDKDLYEYLKNTKSDYNVYAPRIGLYVNSKPDNDELIAKSGAISYLFEAKEVSPGLYKMDMWFNNQVFLCKAISEISWNTYLIVFIEEYPPTQFFSIKSNIDAQLAEKAAEYREGLKNGIYDLPNCK